VFGDQNDSTEVETTTVETTIVETVSATGKSKKLK
jgi:hypothetical protein